MSTDMKNIPKNFTKYKQTKIFDEKTIPKGLLKDHQTLEGVWGKISILSGKIFYVIQSNPSKKIELTPEVAGMVEPLTPHYLIPCGDVKFYVAFYKNEEVT